MISASRFHMNIFWSISSEPKRLIENDTTSMKSLLLLYHFLRRLSKRDVILLWTAHLLISEETFDCYNAFSNASGLNIISTTGYYGAAQEKYLPQHAYSETADQLAARWIAEWKNGIDESGIKPGLIKSGVDKTPLSKVQQKIIDAAALTHLATGLTIGIHTGSGDAAKEELKILERRGVAPWARIWIHAQNEKDPNYHVEAAQRGSWVSFDGVSPEFLSMRTCVFCKG